MGRSSHGRAWRMPGMPSDLTAMRNILSSALPSSSARSGRQSRPLVRNLDAPTVISLAVLALALTLVLATAMTSPLKDDVAWLLYVARRWLAGERLYTDLVEVNPPLIVWIYALPSLVSATFGISPRAASAPFFAAIVLSCAWWTACLLAGRGALFARRLPVFATIGTLLLVLPGVEFGQREHLLIAASLPYLALLARGIPHDGEARAAEPGRLGLAVGMVAGLACALKPTYGVAFGAAELLAWRMGGKMWRPSSLGAAAALALYGVGVLLFCPAFLEQAVPLALALYGGTDTPCWQILLQSRVLLTGVAVSVLLAALAPRFLFRAAGPREGAASAPQLRPFVQVLLAVLAVFAVAAAASYVSQGKNWFYHRLPATVATLLVLLLWLASVAQLRPRRSLAVFAGTLLALGSLASFARDDYQRLQSWVSAAVAPNLDTEVKLERLVKQENAHTYIAFSEWIALGFPVVNDTGVKWASRFDSMWALKGELWRMRQDGAAPKDYPIRRWITRDFVANCPDLAVVDTREGINYVAVLSASDPAFAEAWSRYHQIAAFDGLRVLKRDAAGCASTSPLPPRVPRRTASTLEAP